MNVERRENKNVKRKKARDMNNYHEEAVKNIAVEEDGLGLFCTIPSEMNKDRRYKLRCTESSNEVVVTPCCCKGFCYYKRCKHISIVQGMWNRIYAPVKVEAPKEAPVKKVRKPRNGLVHKVRNGGLVKVAPKVAKTAVQAVVPAPKKDMMSASLYSNKGFSVLR